ncbi:MAG TPA: hypothetical protein VGN14_10760 [Candidatus Elarobacter sp.]|jgi:hypothetical protein
MAPQFCVSPDLSTAYVSYRPSQRIVRQVKVARGRSGRLGAIPFGRTAVGPSQLIADYDAAGELVGVQLLGLEFETLSLAAEFLALVKLPLPAPLAGTIV